MPLPQLIRCSVCEVAKEHRMFSNTQITTAMHQYQTRRPIQGIRCRLCVGSPATTLHCQGPCSRDLPLSAFSKSQRKNQKGQECEECVLWRLSESSLPAPGAELAPDEERTLDMWEGSDDSHGSEKTFVSVPNVAAMSVAGSGLLGSALASMSSRARTQGWIAAGSASAASSVIVPPHLRHLRSVSVASSVSNPFDTGSTVTGSGLNLSIRADAQPAASASDAASIVSSSAPGLPTSPLAPVANNRFARATGRRTELPAATLRRPAPRPKKYSDSESEDEM